MPFNILEIKFLPIRLNHNYYSDLFNHDFLCLIPECFVGLAVFVVLLHGVILASSLSGKNSALSDRASVCYVPTGQEDAQQEGISKVNSNTSSVAVSNATTNIIPNTPKRAHTYALYPSSEKQGFGGILGVNASWIAILSMVFTIALFCNNPISNADVLACCFALDDFALFLKILVVIGCAFSILISLQFLQYETLNHFELQTLILIASIMMLLLISSIDFISIYLAIECQSLCFYVMAGIKRESEFSTEAGLKYFLLGAFSSGILLFGFALQYGFTGTTNFSVLSKIWLSIHESYIETAGNFTVHSPEAIDNSLQFSQAFVNTTTSTSLNFGLHAPSGTELQSHGFGSQLESKYLSDDALISTSNETKGLLQLTELTPSTTKRGCELGMIWILVGFLFKLSAVPFHMWAPDVYEGAPTSVTAFFAIVPKISIIAILLRFCYVASYGSIVSWQLVLILSSILSMILGAFAALAQNKIKRLLAWSSIGHVGFLLTAASCGTVEGVQAIAFYLVIYVIMTIILFQVILMSQRREKVAGFLSFYDNGSKDTVYRESGNLNANALVNNGEIGVLNTSTAFIDSKTKYINDLAFLSQTYSILAMTIMITMFSIAGIPPLAGFWSKAFLLFAAMSAKQFALAMIVIITSVITCFYYIRIVNIMYFKASLSKWRTSSKERSLTSVISFAPISKESGFVLGSLVFVLCFFCLDATALFKATHSITFSLS